jgi:hypothetical protein
MKTNEQIMWDIEENNVIIKDNRDWYVTMFRIVKIKKIMKKLNEQNISK